MIQTPNLFVVGAARCGTTSLHRYLAEHPEIFVPERKELSYFGVGDTGEDFGGPDGALVSGKLPRSLSEYLSYFRGCTDEKIQVDVSPWYLYSSLAAERIRESCPKSKIIAILRNPIDRAYSHYRLMAKLGMEKHERFWDAVAAEQERKTQRWTFGWYYSEVGLYGKQLSRYFAHFAPEQIKIIFFEEFIRDTKSVMGDIYRFLGVREIHPDTYPIYNEAVLPKSRSVKLLLEKGGYLGRLARPIVRERLRRRIRAVIEEFNAADKSLDFWARSRMSMNYKEDKKILESLIGSRILVWPDIVD